MINAFPMSIDMKSAINDRNRSIRLAASMRHTQHICPNISFSSRIDSQETDVPVFLVVAVEVSVLLMTEVIDLMIVGKSISDNFSL